MSELLNENKNKTINDDELDKILEEKEKYKIEKEIQAQTIYNKAVEDPKSLIKANIANNALNLVQNDEGFKKQINKASSNVAQVGIDEVSADNRKNNNTNFFVGREEAIESLGGTKETSKDKQMFINSIYTFWWYVLMTILGIPFIAPLKVLLNWAKALSPTITINKEENGKIINEEIKKLHWLPTIFALLFYFIYLLGIAYLIFLIIK